MKQLLVSVTSMLLLLSAAATLSAQTTIFKDITLIDGKGGTPLRHVDMQVQSNIITAIGKNLPAGDATLVNLQGKFIMPAISSAHVHIGSLKGLANKPANYTRENILSQLKKYGDYGVLNIQVMGSDRPMLFDTGLRDSSQLGLLPGPAIYSAGYGFGVPGNAPPAAMAMDLVFRPASAEEVPAQLDSLVKLKPSMVKIWVDDFQGKFTKMNPAIYSAIISEAHKRNLRVAAHVYYLEDAKLLVAAGLDIIAHSIRDKDIDPALIALMKVHNVAYIPTLSLDEYAFIYAGKPQWVNDPFFRASLEPGVYEMITAKRYQDSIKNTPVYQQNMIGFRTAQRNLKKLADAGILLIMGTDSGATPVRAQGFSEHLEMELMVAAGLSPMEVIVMATQNPAVLLKIDNVHGTLENGKSADFIILKKDPSKNIKNTRAIEAVYKAGKKISNGPR